MVHSIPFERYGVALALIAGVNSVVVRTYARPCRERRRLGIPTCRVDSTDDLHARALYLRYVHVDLASDALLLTARPSRSCHEVDLCRISNVILQLNFRNPTIPSAAIRLAPFYELPMLCTTTPLGLSIISLPPSRLEQSKRALLSHS